MISLADVRQETLRFGPIAYLATANASGEPHVAPTAVAWHDDVVLTFVRTDSRKVRNLRVNHRMAIHYSVAQSSNWDSCIIWGDVTIVDSNEGRSALWDKMGYDLSPFEPGGPTADTHVFLRLEPTKAVILRHYGIGGREVWSSRQ